MAGHCGSVRIGPSWQRRAAPQTRVLPPGQLPCLQTSPPPLLQRAFAPYLLCHPTLGPFALTCCALLLLLACWCVWVCAVSLLPEKPTAVHPQHMASPEQLAAAEALLTSLSCVQHITQTPSQIYALPLTTNMEYGFFNSAMVRRGGEEWAGAGCRRMQSRMNSTQGPLAHNNRGREQKGRWWGMRAVGLWRRQKLAWRGHQLQVQ